ncbi:MAG: HAD family phosphatase [Verrucomicrobiota bacterium]|nr:HAD family phosphatase [Verrucomicrobiota bacterium]MEC9327165.1 HAD family phosphatase [Verrucomicrobiota bacterium]
MQIPKGEFEGYIFDHDGTLSLSMHVHFDGWINAFKKNGGDFEFTRQIAQSYAGIGMHDTVRILNERFGCNMNPEQVVSDQESYFFANLDKVLPYEPVVNFARQCYGKGTPISVASGGIRKTVIKTMEAVGIAEIFEVIITQDDVKNSKPAPDLFLLAAEKMNVRPHKCLVFEDSLLGIEAAKNAGMESFLVTPEDPQ